LADRRSGRLSRSGGYRGVQPPGDTGHMDRPGAGGAGGQGCREVKRDGTVGLVGCWIKAPPKAASPANEFGRMP
jgi:hypothetical protein